MHNDAARRRTYDLWRTKNGKMNGDASLTQSLWKGNHLVAGKNINVLGKGGRACASRNVGCC